MAKIAPPKTLITTWMCSACKREHGILLPNGAELTQEFSSAPRLNLGTTDLRCPTNDKEKPMCACSCHQNMANYRCTDCNCRPNPMFPFMNGQKVQITYPTGTVVTATLTNRGSACLGYALNEAEYIERVIQPDGSFTRSCDIQILEQPKIKQPEHFGAAVEAGSHLNTRREEFIRTHKRGACGTKDPYYCHHWRNADGQMVVWDVLVNPELIREGL